MITTNLGTAKNWNNKKSTVHVMKCYHLLNLYKLDIIAQWDSVY